MRRPVANTFPTNDNNIESGIMGSDDSYNAVEVGSKVQESNVIAF
jgi:hypothetical protein